MAPGLNGRGARVALFLLAPSSLAAENDAATFKKVCGACHATTMVSDLKTESEWNETIDNMTGLGAKGTDDQFAAVRRYLAQNFTKVNVNTAPAEQLAPVLDLTEEAARALVAWRTAHGPFNTPDDLRKVTGIDPAKIDARKDRIAFR